MVTCDGSRPDRRPALEMVCQAAVSNVLVGIVFGVSSVCIKATTFLFASISGNKIALASWARRACPLVRSRLDKALRRKRRWHRQTGPCTTAPKLAGSRSETPWCNWIHRGPPAVPYAPFHHCGYSNMLDEGLSVKETGARRIERASTHRSQLVPARPIMRTVRSNAGTGESAGPAARAR
jgi:hypothetical protein